MATSRRKIADYTQEKEWYNSESGVDRLSSWYTDGKETAFADFVASKSPFPSKGQIVEIGGGAGLQGRHWKRIFGDRYLHTDYAEPMVERARELGLPSQQLDGLNMPFQDGELAGALLIGTSTIIWDQEMREAQFREVYRVLSPGGVAVFVSSRLAGWHYGRRFRRTDLAVLRQLGFKVALFRDWGLIPGKYWPQGGAASALGLLERGLSRVSLGVRRVVIVQKPV